MPCTQAPWIVRPSAKRKRDRVIDPFRIDDAERFIAAIHQNWGEAQGNYDAFRFFTGLRPSEEIALLVSDYEAVNGTLRVCKARVAGIDQNCTKTGEDRVVTLCPRAIWVLSRARSFVICGMSLVGGANRSLAYPIFAIAVRTPHAIHP